MRGATGAMLAAALLAGCSRGSGNSSSSAGAGETQTQAPANLTEDQDNVAIPVTPPSPTPIAAIPAPFQGRWGILGADCDPANAAAAKGLMTIEGDRLSFYEARGTAVHLRQLGPDALLFDLPMTGEGQTWSESTRLSLQDGGRTIIRQATGSPDRTGASTYQRCPA